MTVFCAADNGCTGTIGAVTDDLGFSLFIPVPTYKSRDYNKSVVRHTTHVDYQALAGIFRELRKRGPLRLITERPMKNPKLFNATMSGIRAHEILLAVTRSLGIEIEDTLDSREWQHEMCGPFEKGESKPASARAGCALFPEHAEAIAKHKDADGLLMAEFFRRRALADATKTKPQET